MRGTSLLVPLLAVAALGCGKKTTSFHHCANDSECAANQVCFPDGCGDLAQGLRVEIIPNAREALYAQDFVVGTLANKQDFTLAGPSTIQGAVQQLIDGQIGWNGLSWGSFNSSAWRKHADSGRGPLVRARRCSHDLRASRGDRHL